MSSFFYAPSLVVHLLATTTELLIGKSYGINCCYNVALLTCMCKFLNLLWKHVASFLDNELVDYFSSVADHHTLNTVSNPFLVS